MALEILNYKKLLSWATWEAAQNWKVDEQKESMGKIEKDPLFIREEAGVKKINEFT